jgi:ABC-type lipoprotein release transport system permease subunit
MDVFMVLVGSGAVLASVSLLARDLPSLRASRVDPTVALRQEQTATQTVTNGHE